MTCRKESGLIKGLLSSAVDTFLAPYGRFIEALIRAESSLPILLYVSIPGFIFL